MFTVTQQNYCVASSYSKNSDKLNYYIDILCYSRYWRTKWRFNNSTLLIVFAFQIDNSVNCDTLHM